MTGNPRVGSAGRRSIGTGRPSGILSGVGRDVAGRTAFGTGFPAGLVSGRERRLGSGVSGMANKLLRCLRHDIRPMKYASPSPSFPFQLRASTFTTPRATHAHEAPDIWLIAIQRWIRHQSEYFLQIAVASSRIARILRLPARATPALHGDFERPAKAAGIERWTQRRLVAQPSLRWPSVEIAGNLIGNQNTGLLAECQMVPPVLRRVRQTGLFCLGHKPPQLGRERFGGL